MNQLTAETTALQKKGTSLNAENNKLKNQLLAITKQRYQCDLEQLQSKQIKFDKTHWNMSLTDRDREFVNTILTPKQGQNENNFALSSKQVRKMIPIPNGIFHRASTVLNRCKYCIER